MESKRRKAIKRAGGSDGKTRSAKEFDREVLYREAECIVKTLAAFGIEGCVMEVTPGPVVTSYEFVPVLGTRMSQIAELASDLVMALAPRIVRISAPLPGMFAVGIDVVDGEATAPSPSGC